MAEAKGPGGRPSKWSDAYVGEAKEFLAKGYSLTAFAGYIGVARDTIYAWSDQMQEFSDAIKVGRAKGQALWEERLSAQAATGEGNTAAMIFAMKNLYQDDWRERQEVKQETTLDLADPLKELFQAVAENGKRLGQGWNRPPRDMKTSRWLPLFAAWWSDVGSKAQSAYEEEAQNAPDTFVTRLAAFVAPTENEEG
jgi:hypothetical protein